MSRTACVAWDTDLVRILDSMTQSHVASLLCMVPEGRASTRRWTAREVVEVWEVQTVAGKAVVLRNRAGEEFGDWSRGQSLQEASDRRLILKVDQPFEVDSIPPSGGVQS